MNQQNQLRTLFAKVVAVLLFAIFAFPTETWAQTPYDLWIGDTQVTSENAGNVLGDGKVSFDAKTNSLTLDGIDYSYHSDQILVQSKIKELKVKLVGNNHLTLGDKKTVFEYTGTEASPTVTFVPDRVVTVENGIPSVTFGSLTVEGMPDNEIGGLVSGGYDFASEIVATEITPTTNAASRWTYLPAENSAMKFSYVEAYDLWYGNNRVISTDLRAGVSGAPYFNPETNTILLNADFTNGPINSQLDELTVQVDGVVSLKPANAAPAILYTGAWAGKLTFTCVSESTPASLTMTAVGSNDEGTYKAIAGFDPNNIIFTSPMKLASPTSSDKLLTETTVKVANYDSYGLTIGGTEVTSLNKENIFKGDAANDGKVIYNSNTHTLTLNGATITCPQGSNDGAIVVNTMYPLYVRLQGVTSINAGGLFAFCSTIGNRDATFTTDETSPGQLLMKNAGDKGFFSHIYTHYENGLGHSAPTTDNKQLIALGPVMSPAKGLYWSDQEFSISGQSNILYWDYKDKAAEIKGYSAPFTLTAEPERRHYIANSHELTVDGTTFIVYGDSVTYIIHNKPTFDPEPGIYYEQLAVQLGNLVSPASGSNYPQYWYYLNDVNNTHEPYSNINGASQFINLVESTKVCVYIVDRDAGDNTFSSKDDPVVAEYTIRHRIKAGPNGDVQFADGQTWASFYNTTTTDLYLPDDLAAYIVTAVDDQKATLKAINCVPKNKAVLLKYGETSTTTNESAEGNLLQGTSSAKAVSSISGTVYALHNNKLMKVTSGDIPAGRGYLVVNSENAARQLSMIIDGEGTTAIETVEHAVESDTDQWFMLDGRKLLQKPAKSGLYIKNGNKVVVNK